MEIILIFVLLTCVFNANGFLLDDRTTRPSTGPTISDSHYNALIALLMSEREDRRKLEKEVSFLKNELLATQKGVTDLYHESKKNNETLIHHISSTTDFDEKYGNLQKKYDSLKTDFDTLRQMCGANSNRTNHLELEISSLKQLKAVSDLQTVMNIQNETKHLEQEIQFTNNKLNSITNDVNARKQDFIALFTKADTTEKQLNSSVKETRKMEQEIHDLGSSQNLTTRRMEQEIHELGSSQNLTTRSIEQEIHDLQHEFRKQPNRVAVTAGATPKTYSSGSKILFPNVHTIHGITSSSVTALGTTGEFTCTRPGLYLISVFIMTGTHSTYASVYKNNNIIAYIYFSLNSNAQTNSVTVLEHLAVSDNIYVKAYNNMYVYHDDYSCITILQITE